VVYVRADAAAGGDGERTAPFRTLADAIDAVPDGGAVAIAPGEYAPVFVDRDVALRGACAEVVLTSPDAELPVLEFESSHAVVDNLRITGAATAVSAQTSTLELSRLIVDDVRGVAVSVVTSTVEVRSIRFHDIPDTAIHVTNSSELMGGAIAVTGRLGSAVRSSGTTRLSDIVVAASGEDPEVYVGSLGDDTVLERLAVMGDGTMQLLQGSSLTLRDSTLIGPPAQVAAFSSSILAFQGSHLTLERTSHRRVWTFAMAAAEAETTLVATDVVIRGEAEDAVYDAVEVGEGAHASLTRVQVEGVRSFGVLATDPGTIVTAEDLAIHDTRPDTSSVYGRAIQVQSGATMSGRRVRVVGNHEAAIVASVEASVTLEDLLVEDTMEQSCSGAGCVAGGIGMGVYLGGHITARNFRISNGALAGAQIALDGELDLSAGVVSDNPVGINIQVPDYDLNRLTDEVRFIDNGINLDSRELPLPPPTREL
jgi:hypothetical protein